MPTDTWPRPPFSTPKTTLPFLGCLAARSSSSGSVPAPWLENGGGSGTTDTLSHDVHNANLPLNDAVKNTTVRRKIQAPEIVDLEQTLVDLGNLVL